MWLIPSFGRPGAPLAMSKCPGGMPDNVLVLVNIDDQAKDEYIKQSPFGVMLVPPGSRFADAIRYAFEMIEQNGMPQPFYGILDDDYWPVTPGWWKKMAEAAGGKRIAIANNLRNFPQLYTCRAMGGELARAIGTIAPGEMKHNFTDDSWARFAEDFHLLVPLQDVIVEHRHHLFDRSVLHDATYARGSNDFQEDRERYAAWLKSDERKAQVGRVAVLLGANVTTLRTGEVHLGLCTPMASTRPDVAYTSSFNQTMVELAKRGINFSTHQTAGGSHIGRAREGVLWNAYYHGCTHLLFIDDDMGWDPEFIVRLLASDHDFACVVGAKKDDHGDRVKMACNFLPNPQEFHPVTGFLRLYNVGFAFVMLKRSVIDQMCEAYPELEYDTAGTRRQWALFHDMIDKDDTPPLGQRLGEDFSFCARWRKIGGAMWADPDASLIHAGRKEYRGRLADFFTPAEPVREAAE